MLQVPARDNPVYHVLAISAGHCYDSSMTEPTLTASQIAAVQTELRAVLGLPPEAFPVSTFISMVSDEIEQLRRQKGFTDEDIAEVIRASTQVAVSGNDVGQHYAPPEARHRPHE